MMPHFISDLAKTVAMGMVLVGVTGWLVLSVFGRKR